MSNKHQLLRGAFLLTAAGFLSRIMGFFYKIFLSHTIGAEGIGLYQLIFPVFGFAMAFSVSGISTAISHYVSAKSAQKNTEEMRKFFYSGLFLALALSAAISFFILKNAEFLAFNWIKDGRCSRLLQLMAFSIPFAALHSCISGYYIGLKKAGLSAISQLLEQMVRILSSFILFQILSSKNMTPGPLMAVAGILCAEIFSALFMLTVMLLDFSKTPPMFIVPAYKQYKKLLLTAAPLSSNRLMLSFLQSLEALLIPLRLRIFGYSASLAVSQYGILTGMAFPLIFFPSAITGAISVLLLPTISESQSLNNHNHIQKTTEATIRGCLILGIFCIGLFLLFGHRLAFLLFHNDRAGDYIRILSFSCPFLYLNSTLSSILNGLGKTLTTFFHNAIGLVIRILFIWFLIPRYGLSAYLTGLLFSQLITSLLSFWAIKREHDFFISLWKNLILPAAFLILSAFLSMAFLRILSCLTIPDIVALCLQMLLYTVTYLLFCFFLLRE